MENSTKSQERNQRRLKAASMPISMLSSISDGIGSLEISNHSDSCEGSNDVPTSKTESPGRTQRRMKSASMPERTLQNLATGIERGELDQATKTRPSSNEIINSGRTQRRMKSASMPERTLQNLATGIERGVTKETIDELDQATKTKPSSNEIINSGRTERRMKSASMPERTLQNLATGIERGDRNSGYCGSTVIEDTIDEFDLESDLSTKARPSSNEIENPVMRNNFSSQEGTQRRMKSASMPERTLQNLATGIEKGVIEDTIDEESIDEFDLESDLSTKARPSSNEIENPEFVSETRRRIACRRIQIQGNRLSQISNQSLPDTIYGTPRSMRGKRGYVLVVINHEFGGKPSSLPRGNDIEEISNLFSQHNYVVVGLYNQSKNEILDKIKELACKEDSTRLICFLSSHGDETSLACPIKNPSNTYGNITDVTSKAVPMTACEEKSVQIIDVLRCANTTQLINSPKIFFIDACRTASGKVMPGKNFPEPPGSEYYVGFSCLNQTTCEWQRRESCGIYFDALIEVFKDGFYRPAIEKNKVRDLKHFMDKVHYYLRQQTRNGQPIQTPVDKTTLSGKVFLQGD